MNSSQTFQVVALKPYKQDLLQKIGRATRRYWKRLLLATVKMAKFFDQKWTEGDEIYRRQQEMKNEHLMRYGFNLRHVF